MHGLKYPEPFYSIDVHPDGSRATKVIMLQLISGIILIPIIFSNRTIIQGLTSGSLK